MINTRNQQLSFPNKLSMANWFSWDSTLKEYLNVFGLAGDEIRNQKATDNPEPVRTAKVRELYQDHETGEIDEKVREWKRNLDEAPFRERVKAWQDKGKQLRAERASLWIAMYSNTTEDVLMRAQANRENYDLLQKDSDCVGLYNLLYKSVMSTGSNDVSNLRTKFHSLRQVDPITNKRLTLSEFFREFEGYSKMLENTDSRVSDEDKVEQLTHSLDQESFKDIIFPIKVKQQTFTYSKLKETLTKAEEIFAISNKRKIENSGIAMYGESEEPDKKKKVKTEMVTRQRPAHLMKGLNKSLRRKRI
jgi:hypothetical protein